MISFPESQYREMKPVHSGIKVMGSSPGAKRISVIVWELLSDAGRSVGLLDLSTWVLGYWPHTHLRALRERERERERERLISFQSHSVSLTHRIICKGWRPRLGYLLTDTEHISARVTLNPAVVSIRHSEWFSTLTKSLGWL